MRGCEKKVVFLRHPDSKLFEEAYFVMKKDVTRSPASADMVAEAERILAGEGEALPMTEKTEKAPVRHRALGRAFRFLIPFFIGVGMAAAFFLFGGF